MHSSHSTAEKVADGEIPKFIPRTHALGLAEHCVLRRLCIPRRRASPPLGFRHKLSKTKEDQTENLACCHFHGQALDIDGLASGKGQDTSTI